MTTMKITDFIDLGFNRNEAAVYLSLIKFGAADARQIIEDTKFHKNIVYDNLMKLIDRGLVTFIDEDNRRVFKLSSPHMLVELFKAKQQEAALQEMKAEKLSREIKKVVTAISIPQEASVSRGIVGVKSFYEQTLEGKNYVVFGAPQRSIDIMGETFWHNYNKKRIDRRIGVRMIFNPAIRDYGKRISNRHTLIKYFNKDFEPLTETHVQGDTVGIIVWTDEPLVFIIKEKNVATSYHHYFEDMWKKAKK